MSLFDWKAESQAHEKAELHAERVRLYGKVVANQMQAEDERRAAQQSKERRERSIDSWQTLSNFE